MSTLDMFIAICFNLLKAQSESVPVSAPDPDFKQKVDEFESELSNLVSSFSPSAMVDNTNATT
jgi:hypothetical protein